MFFMADCTVKSVNVHNREYTLLQFHLHATSEHTVNNYHYDAELHFVHKDISGSGNLLVMGIFLHAEEGAAHNRFINNLLGDMAVDDETLDLQESDLNYADMLNGLVGKSHLINYSGSLTTPPCSEIVDWWVLHTPMSISFDDLDKIEKLYSELPSTKDASNNRPPQPLNDREITYYYRRPRIEQRCCDEGQAVIADDFKEEQELEVN
ncbi:hypothetical protein PR003_g32465 [Phytophthora rubi]|uniref:Carbonic anhydrase n=2 Tax=Phytophthora rubi TaxID=129364 RepID=A0A6A4B2V2_9STRA|nr:hypothetical protein PR003_g32465 [Phytophthora rubi]